MDFQPLAKSGVVVFARALICIRTWSRYYKLVHRRWINSALKRTQRRNTRVRNCQRSRFGFVALFDTFEKNIGRSRVDHPLAILARSPRDKFINLATLGGPSAVLASRGIIYGWFPYDRCDSPQSLRSLKKSSVIVALIWKPLFSGCSDRGDRCDNNRWERLQLYLSDLSANVAII